jgi:hypothetical protein
MQGRNEYFFSKTHDKLRGLVKLLLDGRGLSPETYSNQKSQIQKFVKDIQLVLESRISNGETDDMGNEGNIQGLEKNYKDLWILLDSVLNADAVEE